MEAMIGVHSRWWLTEESHSATSKYSWYVEFVAARRETWNLKRPTWSITSVSFSYLMFKRLFSALHLFPIVLLTYLCFNLSQIFLAVSQSWLDHRGVKSNAGMIINIALSAVLLSTSSALVLRWDNFQVKQLSCEATRNRSLLQSCCGRLEALFSCYCHSSWDCDPSRFQHCRAPMSDNEFRGDLYCPEIGKL